MRRLLLCLGLLAALRGPAAADGELALGDQQLQLLERRDALDDADQRPWYRGAAFVQATAGSAKDLDVGAGAAAAVSGLGCDLVDASAQARVRPLAAQRVVAAASWSVCPLSYGLTVVFAGRHELGLAPTIDARRSLWRRRYDSNYQRLIVGATDLFPGRGPHHHGMVIFDVGHGTVEQDDGGVHRRMVQLDIDATIYRYRYLSKRVAAQVDVLRLRGSGIKSGSDDLGGVETTVAPLYASLAVDGWHLVATGGWGMTGGSISMSSTTEVNGQTVESWRDTVDGAGLPELVMPVGSVELGVQGAELSATVQVARTLYPTFDGNVAREDRAAASFAGTAGALGFTLAPFAARTTTWTRDARSTDRSVGLSVAIGHPLTHALRLDGYGEFGLSPYARLDGERAPRATVGGQVLLALTARVAR